MQTFVRGQDLKEDLARLNAHYAMLPDEVKRQGMMSFAGEPPDDGKFLTTQLWDRFLPNWRALREKKNPPLSEDLKKALMDSVKRVGVEGKPFTPDSPLSIEDYQAVTITKKIHLRKGSWLRMSLEVEAATRKGGSSD